MINNIVKLFKNLSEFFNKYTEIKSLKDLDLERDNQKWFIFLINKGFKLTNNQIVAPEYNAILKNLEVFIKDFYDEREETEKDIWSSKNIVGAKIPASGSAKSKDKSLNFNNIPMYYS